MSYTLNVHYVCLAQTQNNTFCISKHAPFDVFPITLCNIKQKREIYTKKYRSESSLRGSVLISAECQTPWCSAVLCSCPIRYSCTSQTPQG